MNTYYERVLLKESKLLREEIESTKDRIKYLEDAIEKYKEFDSLFDWKYEELEFLKCYLPELLSTEIKLKVIDKRTIQLNSFFKNGNIKEAGFYVEGRREGHWIWHHITGQVSMIGTYVKDKLNGQAFRYWRFGPQGKQVWKAATETYLDDKLNGTSVYYDTDGSVIRKENYVDNSLNGAVIHYNKDGDIYKKEIYINDELIEDLLYQADKSFLN